DAFHSKLGDRAFGVAVGAKKKRESGTKTDGHEQTSWCVGPGPPGRSPVVCCVIEVCPKVLSESNVATNHSDFGTRNLNESFRRVAHSRSRIRQPPSSRSKVTRRPSE